MNAFRLFCLALIGATALVACVDIPAPIPTLSLTPTIGTVTAGDATAITINATVTNTTQPVQWTLTGPGTISSNSGNSTQFTAPAAANLTAPVTVTLTATIPDSSISESATITVMPALGSLAVTVTGLPGGVNASVSLKAPNGSSQTLTGSKVLNGLTAGIYTLSAATVVSGASTYIANVSGSPVTVTAGGSATSSVTYTLQSPQLGALEIAVAGLSVGVSASVTVTGSGGFNQTLTAGKTLTDLTPGNYAVTAATVTSAGSIYIASVSGSPAIVTAAKTAKASVTYTVQAPKPATLQVDVSGLPNGVNASVTVTGPAGFNQTLTGGTVLNSLTAGTYTVTAANVVSGASTYIGSVTGSPVTLTAGGTATSSVIYTVQAPQLGSLEVSVVGLPVGVNASVTVAVLGVFNQTLTGSKTLTDLTPDTYAITPATVTSGGSIYTASVNRSPVEVSPGAISTVIVTYTVQTGTLKVNIAGLPNGAKANVMVSGPNGFHQTLTTTSLLTDLIPGSYTLDIPSVRLVGSVVDFILDGVGANAVNIASAITTTTQVTYSLHPGTAALWLPRTAGTVAYKASSLGFGGNSMILPNVTLDGNAGGVNASIVFDGKGNLWTLNSTNNTILEFSASQLSLSGTPSPVKTISSSAGSLSRPASLAFDVAGNLWVANLGNDTLVMFTPYQLSQTDNPTPGLIISANTGGSSPTLHGVSSLAFDQSGNLWVLNGASPQNIVRFTPDQLTRSGTPIPTITLNPSLGAGSSIAFDSSGNLWVSDLGNSTLVMFSMASLTTDNSARSLTLSSNGINLSNPAGLAFDSSGDLWVTNTGNNTLVEFTPDQLTASGTPDAMSTISNVNNLAFGSIAFNPAPLNLPLAH